MPKKQQTITLSGPWPVLPSIMAQAEIRSALTENARGLGVEINYNEIMATAGEMCAPREGFLVTQTRNTLEVDPGAIISRRRVLELISNPNFVVDVKEPKVNPDDRRETYANSRSVFLALDPIPEG